MKITSKILHYPPYISTRWAFVQALYLKGKSLVICLKDSNIIEIPELSSEILDTIFNSHAQFLESERQFQGEAKEVSSSPQPVNTLQDSFSGFPFMKNTESFSLPNETFPPMDGNIDSSLRFGFGPIENLGAAMHHNSAQSNLPDLPQEILSKIAAVAKIVAPEEVQAMPKPEPHCNCTFCQIARALQTGGETTPQEEPREEPAEEEVSDEELQFQQWEITQTGERLYSVINRLDSHEKYSVYLGHPVGCTCGKDGCEHIVAVLNS
jgi:hypothetical protein